MRVSLTKKIEMSRGKHNILYAIQDIVVHIVQ